jgi:hypothetical protein
VAFRTTEFERTAETGASRHSRSLKGRSKISVRGAMTATARNSSCGKRWCAGVLNPAAALPVTENLKEAERGKDLPMNANPVLWLQAYIIGVLIFLISITAITEHPEWFN